jgi:hypothetical protein
MLKKGFIILSIIFTVLQIINISIDIVKKISCRTENTAVYQKSVK